MLSLPILDTTPQRPLFAQGPRTLSSVKMLRISVTDRCNLRCVYCMPEGGVEWMSETQRDLMSPADFEAVARVAVKRVGVKSLKLTGGEPTIRPDLVEIVDRLGRLGVSDISLTTNGLLLPRLAKSLRDAGVRRVTLSCDSLRPDRFAKITGGGSLDQFWAGVEASEEAGFDKIKFNVVVIAGVNDDEVADFAALAIDKPWTIRFIEYMPLGDSSVIDGLKGQGEAAVIDSALIRQRIEQKCGVLRPVNRVREVGVGPAEVFTLPRAAGRVGFISAMSQPFCETCNRLRLTSMGELRSCLFDGGEVNLLPALHPEPNEEQLVNLFEQCVILKPDTHSRRGNRAMSQIGG